MPYIRRSSANRRYSSSKEQDTSFKQFADNIAVETIKEPVRIPLPDDEGNYSDNRDFLLRKSHGSFFDILKGKITVEEIVLIGLIILLLDEGIEDELLLILLVYILLF
jgi:hypothetical protein